MALAVASTTTVSANSSTSLVISKPSGVAVGDLLLIVSSGAGNTGYPLSTGFTRILERGVNGNEDTCVGLLYRIADASDVSASNYTITNIDGGSQMGGACMLRVTGWTTGNPLFGSSTAEAVVDLSSYSLGASGLSISRPSQQLLIIAGIHMSEDNYADYSAYTITSSDANPTWTIVSNNVDFTTSAGLKENTFFCAYALSSNTSTITAFSVDVASSISGGVDSDAAIFAVICTPLDTTGTNALFEITPTIFTNTGVEVGGTGTNALLQPQPEFFDESGSITTPTQWTNTTKSNPSVWTTKPKS